MFTLVALVTVLAIVAAGTVSIVGGAVIVVVVVLLLTMPVVLVVLLLLLLLLSILVIVTTFLVVRVLRVGVVVAAARRLASPNISNLHVLSAANLRLIIVAIIVGLLTVLALAVALVVALVIVLVGLIVRIGMTLRTMVAVAVVSRRVIRHDGELCCSVERMRFSLERVTLRDGEEKEKKKREGTKRAGLSGLWD